MISVPAGTFLSQFQPQDQFSDIIANPRYYSGFPVSFQSTKCPALYAKLTGVSNCNAWCFNSCPELHPNTRAGLEQIQSQGETIVTYLDKAITASEATANAVAVPVPLTGSVAFPVPKGALPTHSNAVFDKIEVDLVLPAANSLSVTCDPPTSTEISCTFEASMATSKLAGFSDDKTPSYTFKSDFLLSQYGDIVANWFAVELATTVADNLVQTAESFNTVSIQVPKRFVTALGSPFPSSLVCTTIASSLGVDEGAIPNARV
jgi:hypothetical protein